jgi:lambda family phage portal protein
MASAAILDMNMSAGYREALLIGQRVAACQMGVWERPANSTGTISFNATEDNKAQQDMEPGKFTIAPRGWTLKTINPERSGADAAEFLKTMSRSEANGLDVSYNDFANDLTAVNFSSLRAGTLSERDGWKMEQKKLVDNFCMIVFHSWLEQMLLTGRTFLPFSKFDKFFAPVWVCRRWDWVDPLKDVKADREALELHLVAPQEIIEAHGRDPEEILEMWALWNALVLEYQVDKNPNMKEGNSDGQ